MKAALALGADAVQIGTRFLASQESAAADVYKKALLQAEGSETAMTRLFSGKRPEVLSISGWRKKDEMKTGFFLILYSMYGQHQCEKRQLLQETQNKWLFGQVRGWPYSFHFNR